MNLNGGYIMLDLDDTSGLLDRTIKVFESGKPSIIKKDNIMYYAVKYRNEFNDYCFALSNNKMFSIDRFSGQLTENIVLDTKKYKHIGSFNGAGSGGGVPQKFVIEAITTYSSVSATVQNILASLYNAGYISENTMTLCVYGSNYAQVYVTRAGGGYTLHFKPSGATGFDTLTNGSFLNATVIEF